MKLFDRVKQVASKVAGSQKSLGEALGLSGRTFEGYLTESRQDNLWPLLPQILASYPQIRRDWLYFGEGEMLADVGRDVRVPPMRTAMSPMKTVLACENVVPEDALSAFKAELHQEQVHVRELLWENRQLRMELDRLRQVANSENFVEPTAPASRGVAHCLRCGSERLPVGARLQEPQGDGLPAKRQGV